MDARQRRALNHLCDSCTSCRSIVHAILSLRPGLGRSPSFSEINAHIGGAFKALSTVEYHVKALLAQGFLVRTGRYSGLVVMRVPGEAAL